MRSDAALAREIVVVAGVPRSGTSLLMQMLRAGGLPLLSDGARPPDPDNPRGYFELAAARRLASDPGFLAAAPGHALKLAHVLVPKLPECFGYRVLLVERDLDEVLASQERMLSRTGADPGPQPPAERLAAVLRSQLDAVRRWLDARPNVRWLPVRHAELMRRPAAVAAEIAAFLDRIPRPEPMAAVVEPALYRQRRPIVGR